MSKRYFGKTSFIGAIDVTLMTLSTQEAEIERLKGICNMTTEHDMLIVRCSQFHSADTREEKQMELWIRYVCSRCR